MAHTEDQRQRTTVTVEISVSQSGAFKLLNVLGKFADKIGGRVRVARIDGVDGINADADGSE